MTKKKWIELIIIAIAGVVIAFLPPPEGITQQGMIFAGIFLSALALLVLSVVPEWIASLYAIIACGTLGVCTVNEAMAGFATDTILLLLAGYLFAAALTKTAAMKRVGLKLVSFFPGTEKYRGQVLATMATSTILSPLYPDLMTRISIMGPITAQIDEVVGTPKKSKKALGMFFGVYIPCYIMGNAFLSGHTNVILLWSYMTDELSNSVKSWGGWFAMTWPWVVVLLVGTFVFSAIICKPKGEDTEFPKSMFKERYDELGKITSKEVLTLVVLAVFIVALLSTSVTGLSITLIFLIADFVLFFGGLIELKDLKEAVPWNLVIFIAMLLAVPGYISKLGWANLIADLLTPVLGPLVTNVWLLIPLVMVITVLLRFVVPSQLATLTIIVSVFSSFLPQAGISLAVVIWASYMIGNTWHIPASNGLAMAAFSMNGGYVDEKAFCKTSWYYVAMTFVSMMISIPLWKLLGLC